jgi:DNA replication protein DnaC
MDNILADKLTLCKLSGIHKSYERILNEAKEHNLGLEQFFMKLMEEEVICRENNRFNRLYKRANFPLLKTIDNFDFMSAPFLRKNNIMPLFSCEFISQSKNLIFIGNSGVGKTHVAISLGVEACRQGKTVAFYTAAALGNKLVELQDEYQLSKFIDRLRKIDLLIIDELGYVELSKTTTQLMFQIFSERYEKGSIIVTTNLKFEEWPKVFYDERMTTAIIDRIIHNSQIVIFDGDSYRLKESLSNKKEISPS